MRHTALLFITACFFLGACVSTSGGGSSSGTSGNAGVWSATKSVLDTVGVSNILGGLGQAMGSGAGLSLGDISLGLKQALNIGTDNVVQNIGIFNGFYQDQNIRIPLPGTLGKVHDTLDKFGMGSMTQDLEMRLNRAAEQAIPKAKTLFVNAISQMSFDDARGILNGPQDAATQYLRRTMGAELSREIQPIVSNAIQQAGAVQAYDSVMAQYSQIPFVPQVKDDLNSYVVDKALDGLFFYVAQEEQAIRADPAKRTTELLRKVFAQK